MTDPVMNDPGMNDPGMNDAAATFEDHRRLLVGAAYRLLGSHSDAEDVVQEAWIRWSTVDPSTIDEPRAYLLTITTRLALNRLRQLRTRRESYVGPWLPEPVSSDPRDDGAAATELADDVSMAMLIVLESLSPLERAAFVLADVFGMPSGEVAGALDRSPAAVRQLVHRARSHIEARQPRSVVDTARHREVTERFLEAASTGDARQARRRHLTPSLQLPVRCISGSQGTRWYIEPRVEAMAPRLTVQRRR